VPLCGLPLFDMDEFYRHFYWSVDLFLLDFENQFASFEIRSQRCVFGLFSLDQHRMIPQNLRLVIVVNSKTNFKILWNRFPVYENRD
jgi:hypothetical protein